MKDRNCAYVYATTYIERALLSFDQQAILRGVNSFEFPTYGHFIYYSLPGPLRFRAFEAKVAFTMPEKGAGSWLNPRKCSICERIEPLFSGQCCACQKKNWINPCLKVGCSLDVNKAAHYSKTDTKRMERGVVIVGIYFLNSIIYRHAQTKTTFISALVKRVLCLTPVPMPDIWLEVQRFFAVSAIVYVFPRPYDSFDFCEWNRKFPAYTRKRNAEAVALYGFGTLQEVARETRCGCFVKADKEQ